MNYICTDCPRACKALRNEGKAGGFCLSPSLARVSRAAPHFGEEPCISGSRGSGTVFFSGCNLRCVFCQNHEISRAAVGKSVSTDELRDIFLRLQDEGVHNINLVTPSHYSRAIAKALESARLSIPVAWNSSGYDKVETLRRLEGLVQIYMPDFKYFDSELAGRYSSAPDYPEVAQAAIKEMYRQVGEFVLDDDGLLRSGLLIRHLILPQQRFNSMDVIDFVAEEFPEGSVLFSLMSQYTPMPGLEAFPELCEPVDKSLSDDLISYMRRRGIYTGYWQESESASDEMIPDFDLTGV